MMKFDAEVKFDTSGVIRTTSNDTEQKQKTLDSLVLQDSNRYCPQDTGALMKSAILHTVIGSGEVVWQTPYAHRQYYNWKGGAQSHNRNLNATSKWFETALVKHGAKWMEAIGAEYR